MEESKNKFLEIRELFKRLSHQICLVVTSYYIWRTLRFSRSIDEVGKEKADKNAKLMSSYSNFFIPTEDSHVQTFVLGLMKFFDKDRRALSFQNLIKEIEENKSVFTPEVLKAVHPKLDEIGAIESDYVPINQETIDEVDRLRKKHDILISNLKDIRDKQFAHNDIEVIKGVFVPNEIEELITAVQEMFNKLSGTFDLSSTVWDHLKDEAVNDTKYLLESLEHAEVEREREMLGEV